MKEFDFDSVWESSDERANEFYRSVEPKILKMAQQKSSDILAKLRRNIINEWVLSSIAFIYIAYALYGYPYYALIMITAVVGSLIYAIPYINVLKEMKEVSTQNTVDFIKSNIKILDTFIKKLKLFTWATMPIALIFGFLLGISEGGKFDKMIPSNIMEALILISVFGVVFAVFAWLIFKQYIPSLYGNRKAEMEELLRSLESNEA